MADTLSKIQRSRVMALVRSTGNKATELKLVSLLRAAGIKGWRRNPSLFGKPDFVFRKQRLAVFADGCYWHGCPEHCRMPKSNIAFWRSKIARNKKRDLLVRRTLRKAGWRVLRIWEHELKRPRRCIGRLCRQLCISIPALPDREPTPPPSRR